MRLVHGLIRSCVERPSDAWETAARRTVEGASPRAWRGALRALRDHRLLPSVASALSRHGMEDIVPPVFGGAARDALRRTALTNALLMHTLARVLEELRARDVEPVIWKGVVLADGFYPDPGARWMGDIDLSIDPEEVDRTMDAFEAAGVRARPELATRDAVYFESPTGVIFDVHHQVRLFEGWNVEAITRDIAPRHVPTATMRVLDPEAMLTHLIVHLAGHRADVGYLGSWILDLAYVLERWGEGLDRDRLATMLGDAGPRVLWRRVLGLLGDELGVGVPAWCADEARGAAPLRLGEVLRQRRIVAWGLPAPRGWMRLGAHRLLGRPGSEVAAPGPADLCLWPLDAMRERRSAA